MLWEQEGSNIPAHHLYHHAKKRTDDGLTEIQDETKRVSNELQKQKKAKLQCNFNRT